MVSMVKNANSRVVPTYVVGADLERLLLPHEEARLLALLVLQELGLPNTSLLPLSAVIVESVHFALPAGSNRLMNERWHY